MSGGGYRDDLPVLYDRVRDLEQQGQMLSAQLAEQRRRRDEAARYWAARPPWNRAPLPTTWLVLLGLFGYLVGITCGAAR